MGIALTNQQLKRLFVATILIVIFLFMVWARVFYGSMQAYQKGESYIKKGQYIRAITFLDRSMHWYAPLNSYVERSAQRLWEIGRYAQKNGDIRLSLIAVRTIKRGFLSARSFYTPGKGWIEKCNLRIQELVRIEGGQESNEKEGKLVDTMFKESEGKPPDVVWSVILLIGLLGWVGSVLTFIMARFHVSQEGTRISFSSCKWMFFGIFFFTAWIVGMVNA
jgi:hypothetical protein